MQRRKLKYWKNQKPESTTTLFIDNLFPPNENSLINPKDKNIQNSNSIHHTNKINPSQIEWKRPSEIFGQKKYLIFEDKIEISDILQGSLNDCPLLASLGALAKYPNLIFQLFKTKTVNENGLYEIIFFIDGEFQIIIIDDYLPVNKNTKNLAFAKNKNNEIWVCLIEKAWAKLNGSYNNITNNWMHQILEVLTGFPSKFYLHTSYKIDDLWSELTFANSQNCILSCSTNINVKDTGLIDVHAYTLIGTYVIRKNGELIKLVRLRNTWGYGEWKGDWSDKSNLWDDECKKQVEYVDKDDGTFYMSFNDYYKYFITSIVCYVQYLAYSKNFKIFGDNLYKGNIFNVYLDEEGLFSVSIIRKNYIYNQGEISNRIPSFLIIMKYNPSEEPNNILYDLEGQHNSYENCCITKILKEGYYLIYTYHDILYSDGKKEDYYFIKTDSSIKFKIRKTMVDDPKEGFPFLKKIILQDILNTQNPKENTRFTSFISSYKKTGIGHRCVYNEKDTYIKYTEDISQLNNMFVLSPYNPKESFDWYIPPKSYNLILGLQIDSNKKGVFSLKAKVNAIKNIPLKEPEIILDLYINDTVSRINNSNVNYYYDSISLSLEKAKEELHFSKINISKMTLGNVQKLQPEIMKLILKLKPVSNDKDLSWVIGNMKNGKYIGQINSVNKREGRGAFCTSSGIFIGHYDSGYLSGEGIIYSNDLKKILFKGNFENGKKKGKGIEFYSTGEKYEGDFDDDVKNGKGVLVFKSGRRFEGFFKNDCFDGKGVIVDKGKVENVEYENGVLKK